MEMKPKISVIVPIYNVEKYLRECLESIVAQTYKGIEIILVDDRGLDDSMAIAREFAARDKRIKIITHKKNGGLSAARNTGIKNSSAPFVMFVDSDDLVAPTFCEKLLAAVESSGADWAVCGTDFIYEADRYMADADAAYYKIKFEGLQDMSDKVLRNCIVPVWNKIYRRGILKRYGIGFPEGLCYEDSYFYNAYACWTKTIFFVDEKLYTYRRRAGSIMNETLNRKSRSSINHLKIAIALYEYLRDHGLFQKHKDLYGEFFFGYLMSALYHEPAKRGRAKIYKLANDFIRRERWCADMFPPDLRERFQMLADRTLLGEKKSGMIKFIANLVCAFVPSKKLRHEIRMRVLYKKLWGPMFKNKHFCPFAVDSAELLARLRALGSFAYIPNSGNMGDMLIASATMQFFDRNKLRWRQVQSLDESPEAVVYGGGGIWTADYEWSWSKLLPVFARAKRVVILPSSFNDCRKLIDAMDERFVVFCREKKSYDYLTSMNKKAKIFLDHDMAFRMQKKILDLAPVIFDGEREVLHRVAEGMRKVPRVARFMREDCESAGKYETDFDLSAAGYSDFNASRGYIDFNAQLMLCAVDAADAVITDRLHVGIAGALMGKEVYMLDNTYGKLSNVYKNSMADNPRVHFCTKMPKGLKPKRTATDNLKRMEGLA